MKQRINSLKGTRDFYPADVRDRRAMIDPLCRTAESFGYEAYEAPLLESFTLYAAKSSPEIIERQSYVFEDRGGERVVVRPEMTPSLARMIANKQRELPSILRWYCAAECWRYERPQKGRLRNFLQVNVDLLGSDTVEADTEVLQVALTMLRDLGVDLASIELRINDRTLLEAWLCEAGVPSEVWVSVISLLDERTKLDPDMFRINLEKMSSASSAKALLQKLDQPVEERMSDPRAARLKQIKASLEGLGIGASIRVDPTIIRGFAYYTGLVFEVYETSGQFGRAIFGGGRYNNLVESVGGSSISGVGFGVSDVSLQQLLEAQLLEKKNIPLKTVALIPRSDEEAVFQIDLAKRLREEGIDIRTSLPPYGFSSQLKLAQKSGISTVILISSEEWKQGGVCLRNLDTGEQAMIPIEEVVRACRDRLTQE